MYTVLENARIVIALLKEHNIRHIVVSPGGSNIPIVQGIQQDPFFKCYSVVDERSAMYFAIGLSLELGEPVATSCTSAQATRNYIPGLTEAFYKKVPILAITMSKHPKYLGQEYMQCPIQTSLPVDAIKKSYSLPYISNEHDRQLCVRMANEAILELTHNRLGPVQLNIEELDSQTWLFEEKLMLPKVRCIRRFGTKAPVDADLTGKRIMLLIGEHRPFSEREKAAIERFSERYNVLVYADHISNYRGKYCLNANLIAASTTADYFAANLRPDILITIGGLTGDYYIYTHLASSPEDAFEHWRVNPDGEVIDTYGHLTRIFEMDFDDFDNIFVAASSPSGPSYYNLFKDLLARCRYDSDIPLSNMYMAQQLHDRIPSGSSMHFAILNSLRVWSVFPIASGIDCYSNVAAFGIDGCLSTLIGQSVARPDRLMFHVTGDLSFFYDMNALGIRHIGNNIRILLVNNNGGVEFKLGNLQEHTDVGSFIAANDHFKNARGWAETNGFMYLSATTKEEAKRHIETFVSESSSPIILEVFTKAEDERTANIQFFEDNKVRTTKEQVRKDIINGVKSIVGEEAMSKLRRMMQ